MSARREDAPPMPYVGLMPYLEEDAEFFFGRDLKRDVIIDNLMAARLTVLYGASGVGKSSVLRAGVAHHLRRQSLREAGAGAVPEFAVVVYSSWRDDPLLGLTERIRDSLAQLSAGLTLGAGPGPGELARALKKLTFPDPDPERRKPTLELLVILDQFEEYFLYHGGGEDAFADEFARIVNDPAMGVNFLVSIRDDALAKLDSFKGRIFDLFDNRLSIDHLDAAAARQAIVEPLRHYNLLVGGPAETEPLLTTPEEVARFLARGGAQVGIEDGLVTEVLKQVKTGQVLIGQAGRGQVKDGDESAESARIETPYLQLVMTRLWKEEAAAGSRVLRLSALEALGGAARIVQTHLDTTMGSLAPEDRDVAAAVFHYLVTPSGSKIAHGATDLSAYTGLPEARVRRVLTALVNTNERILRPVPAPLSGDAQAGGGPAGETRYEIFHDVLAAAVLDWRDRHTARQEQERAEAEAERRLAEERAEAERLAAEKERELERERARAEEQRELAEARELLIQAEQGRAAERQKSLVRLRWLVAFLFVMAVLALGAAAYAVTQQRKAAANAAEARRNEEIANRFAAESQTLRDRGAAAQQKAEGLLAENQELIGKIEQRERDARAATAESERVKAEALAAQAELAKAQERSEEQKTIDRLSLDAQTIDRSGDKPRAVAEYKKTFDLFERTGDLRRYASTHYAVGAIYRDMSGDPGKYLSGDDAKELAPADKAKLAAEHRRNAIHHFEESRRLYQESGRKEKAGSPGRDTALFEEAAALSTLGEVYLSESRNAGAKTERQEALRKSIDDYEQARVLYRQGKRNKEYLFTLNKLVDLTANVGARRAVDYNLELLSAYEAEGKTEERAGVLDELGRLYLVLRENERALETYRRALDAYRSLKDKLNEAKALTKLGETYTALGQTPAAVAAYEQVLDIYSTPIKASGGGTYVVNTQRAEVRNSLGGIYRARGEKMKALEAYRKAEEEFRQEYPTFSEDDWLIRPGAIKAAVVSFTAVGELSRELGNLDEAIKAYTEAATLHRTIRRASTGPYGPLLYRSYRFGDAEKAAEHKDAEVKILNILGDLYTAQGDAAKAQESYRKAQEVEQEKLETPKAEGPDN